MSLSCHLPHPQGQRPEHRDAVWAEPRQRALCVGVMPSTSPAALVPAIASCLGPALSAPAGKGPAKLRFQPGFSPLNSCSLV